MSNKKEQSLNKTGKIIDNKRLTRKQVEENPELKVEIINPFQKIPKIIRTPPKSAPFLTQSSQSFSFPLKNINTEKSELPSTSAGETTSNTIKSSSKTHSNLDLFLQFENEENKNLTKKINRDSAIALEDTIFNDTISQNDYTDIDGFTNEQSLIGNTLSPSGVNNLIKDINNLFTTENIIDMANTPQVVPLTEAVKIVPYFDGKNMSLERYIERLNESKSLVREIDESTFIKFVKNKLDGEVRKALYNSTIDNTKDFIAALRQLYPNNMSINALYWELERIQQYDGERVINYTNRITDILLKILEIKKLQPNQTEESIRTFKINLQKEAAKYFKNGLKLQLQLRVKDHDTLNTISAEAIQYESLDMQKNSVNNYQSSFSQNILNSVSQNPYDNLLQNEANNFQNISQITQNSNVSSCQLCKLNSHEALFCNIMGCAYCKSKDHISINCNLTTRKINLICKCCNQSNHSVSTCKLNTSPLTFCQYCQETSHEANECPFIKQLSLHIQGKLLICEICEGNHLTKNCLQIICIKCGKIGHNFKSCNVENTSVSKLCVVCSGNHDTSECDKVKVLAVQSKMKQNMQCQLCFKPGHEARNCFTYQRTTNQNNFKKHSNFNRNYNNNPNSNFNKNHSNNPTKVVQNKTCSYCDSKFHTVENCKKLQALRESSELLICDFCKGTNHTIKNCFKVKEIESRQSQFCINCKSTTHTTVNCYRNTNSNPGNVSALPGSSA